MRYEHFNSSSLVAQRIKLACETSKHWNFIDVKSKTALTSIIGIIANMLTYGPNNIDLWQQIIDIAIKMLGNIKSRETA